MAPAPAARPPWGWERSSRTPTRPRRPMRARRSPRDPIDGASLRSPHLATARLQRLVHPLAVPASRLDRGHRRLLLAVLRLGVGDHPLGILARDRQHAIV